MSHMGWFAFTISLHCFQISRPFQSQWTHTRIDITHRPGQGERDKKRQKLTVFESEPPPYSHSFRKRRKKTKPEDFGSILEGKQQTICGFSGYVIFRRPKTRVISIRGGASGLVLLRRRSWWNRNIFKEPRKLQQLKKKRSGPQVFQWQRFRSDERNKKWI